MTLLVKLGYNFPHFYFDNIPPLFLNVQGLFVIICRQSCPKTVFLESIFHHHSLEVGQVIMEMAK